VLLTGLPAVKLSPGLPLILPLAIASRVWIARYPRSAGFQSSKAGAAPLLTYARIWFGVPRPVTITCPILFASVTARADAAIPTVVGEMMPFTSGYVVIRPCASV